MPLYLFKSYVEEPMQIVINPGSGPVADATVDHATTNMHHFITDLDIKGLRMVRVPDDDSDGRFGFLLWQGTHCTEVEMPGIPLAKVRFMREDGQDPWDFPRLYVDGSSWLWCFALNSARSDLDPTHDDDE
jgi:hypothetical protein